MAGTSIPDSAERERLLLLAAYLHPQRTEDRVTANSWRVIRQAMLWAGVLDGEIEATGGQGDHPVIEEWHRALIDMAYRVAESEALLWVAGNLGNATEPPAWAAFTGCGLTARGKIVAEQLLGEHPRYRS
ncbi:MAG TPA: hypothetical protein VG269_26160 [Tepidisphaeraceae bacterium]|jgi:hypothetical protein|nr:hypothetical protein [Tepidisphaeraceae bacterium]